MKKKEDLEAIVDLLYEYCLEHGEYYAHIAILFDTGIGDISSEKPDHSEVHVYKDYKKDPGSGNWLSYSRYGL